MWFAKYVFVLLFAHGPSAIDCGIDERHFHEGMSVHLNVVVRRQGLHYIHYVQ